MRRANMYSIGDIVAASEKLFGGKYSAALIAAALKHSKKENFTKEEAIEIVDAFANRKVN